MISITGIIFILGIAMVTAAIKGWLDAPYKRSRPMRDYHRTISRSSP